MANTLANTYNPLKVKLVRGEGTHVWDDAGREYLDMLAGYSALNFGHRHPALIAAAHSQLDTLTLTSRAFKTPTLRTFADRLTELTQTQTMVPMNTGAEAVETAVKIARKWGNEVRKVENPVIIVAEGSFHGRTMTAVSTSSDPVTRAGFGPYLPGFRHVPFGDADAIIASWSDDVVAVFIEPVQGEAGVIVPPADYLSRVASFVASKNALLVLDEVQSGLGRTGDTLAAQTLGVRADVTCLGKALGGGIMPVSAVVGRDDVVGVLTPGTHGSTFGGNPLACAVGLAVIELLETGEPQQAARDRGEQLRQHVKALVADGLIANGRVIGLWAGIDLLPDSPLTGKEVCGKLAENGVLVKETHQTTIRISPPLVISAAELDKGMDTIRKVLAA